MSLRVAAIQMRGEPAPVRERLARADALLADAARQGAQLAVMPELALTGYALGEHNASVAEPVSGLAVATLIDLARAHDVIVVAGMAEREGRHVYDTMVVVGPEGFLGRYRKLHPAGAERAAFRPGTGAAPIETDLGRIGVGVCADMIHRTPWSSYARARVDLVAIGAAWPDYRDAPGFPLGPAFREMHLRSTCALPERIERAVGAPVVLANACGDVVLRMPPLHTPLHARLAGRSRVVCGGTIAVDERGDEERAIVAEVQGRGECVEAARERWIPHGTPAFRALLRWTDVVSGAGYGVLYEAAALRRAARARQVRER